MNTLSPSPALLCKLASIVVHADEMFSVTGHEFDKIVLEQLIKDSDVQAWLVEMDRLSMIPKKRTIEDARLFLAKKQEK